MTPEQITVYDDERPAPDYPVLFTAAGEPMVKNHRERVVGFHWKAKYGSEEK